MALTTKTMTVEEYLALEPEEGVKYEWINGDMYAMSGGRPRHNVVSYNVGIAFAGALDASPCWGATPDQRLYVRATEAFLFPDFMVVCPPWDMVDGDVQSVTNPTVVCEVLSPSTISYDRGAKFEHYRLVPSITDVLFIDPDRRSVTHFVRTETGWTRRDLEHGSLAIVSLDIELSVSAFFDRLEHVPAE